MSKAKMFKVNLTKNQWCNIMVALQITKEHYSTSSKTLKSYFNTQKALDKKLRKEGFYEDYKISKA